MIELDDLGFKIAGGLGVFASTIGTAIVGVFFSRLAALDAKIERVKREYQDADDKLRLEAEGAERRLRQEFKADIDLIRTEITHLSNRLVDKMEATDDNLTDHRVYVEKIIANYATRQEIMAAFSDIKAHLK